MKAIATIALSLGLSVAHAGEAKRVRATELNNISMAQLLHPNDAVVVEFRQGDQIPITIAAKGDLMETSQAGVTNITIKRNFWLLVEGENVQISLDGSVFKQFNQVLMGSLSADSGSGAVGGVMNAINIIFAAYLK